MPFPLGHQILNAKLIIVIDSEGAIVDLQKHYMTDQRMGDNIAIAAEGDLTVLVDLPTDLFRGVIGPGAAPDGSAPAQTCL